MKVTLDIVESLYLVEIFDGRIRLRADYQSDTENGYLKMCEYGCEWEWDKTDSRILTDFFSMVDERNGEVAGGIYINDEYTLKELQDNVDCLKVLKPCEVAEVEDGIYILNTKA